MLLWHSAPTGQLLLRCLCSSAEAQLPRDECLRVCSCALCNPLLAYRHGCCDSTSASHWPSSCAHVPWLQPPWSGSSPAPLVPFSTALRLSPLLLHASRNLSRPGFRLQVFSRAFRGRSFHFPVCPHQPARTGGFLPSPAPFFHIVLLPVL